MGTVGTMTQRLKEQKREVRIFIPQATSLSGHYRLAKPLSCRPAAIGGPSIQPNKAETDVFLKLSSFLIIQQMLAI